MLNFLIIINALLMSLGQILFKYASLFMNSKGTSTLIEKYLYNPWLLFAIFTYGLATLLWVYILTSFKLSVVYPVTIGLSYVLTLAGAYFIFGEPLGFLGGVGIMLILVGIIFVAL